MINVLGLATDKGGHIYPLNTLNLVSFQPIKT